MVAFLLGYTKSARHRPTHALPQARSLGMKNEFSGFAEPAGGAVSIAADRCLFGRRYNLRRPGRRGFFSTLPASREAASVNDVTRVFPKN
jgi:hypothetical protein